MGRQLKVAFLGASPELPDMLRVMRRTQLLDVVSIYDPDALAAPWAKGLGIDRVHRTLNALLREKDIDLYWVDVPTSARYGIVRNLLERNRPVVVTGPACLSEQEWFDLMQLQDKRFAYLALPERFGDEIQWWKDMAHGFGLSGLEGFESVFLASFIRPGGQLLRARYAGDAWYYAGLRGLLVIGEFLDMEKLWIDSARMSNLHLDRQRNVQASVQAYFDRVESESTGHGFFDVNWIIDENRMFTRLWHEGAVDNEVLLDHSEHTVHLRTQHEWSLLYSGPEPGSRVIEESGCFRCWRKLFEEVVSAFESGKGNFEQISAAHRAAVSRHGVAGPLRTSPAGYPPVPDTTMWAAG